MKTEKFSKTTSLLLIATALAMAGTVSAADIVDPSASTLMTPSVSSRSSSSSSATSPWVLPLSSLWQAAPLAHNTNDHDHLGPDCRYRRLPLLLHARCLHRPRYRVHRIPIHGLDHHRSVDGPQVPILVGKDAITDDKFAGLGFTVSVSQVLSS